MSQQPVDPERLLRRVVQGFLKRQLSYGTPRKTLTRKLCNMQGINYTLSLKFTAEFIKQNKKKITKMIENARNGYTLVAFEHKMHFNKNIVPFKKELHQIKHKYKLMALKIKKLETQPQKKTLNLTKTNRRIEELAKEVGRRQNDTEQGFVYLEDKLKEQAENIQKQLQEKRGLSNNLNDEPMLQLDQHPIIQEIQKNQQSQSLILGEHSKILAEHSQQLKSVATTEDVTKGFGQVMTMLAQMRMDMSSKNVSTTSKVSFEELFSQTIPEEDKENVDMYEEEKHTPTIDQGQLNSAKVEQHLKNKRQIKEKVVQLQKGETVPQFLTNIKYQEKDVSHIEASPEVKKKLWSTGLNPETVDKLIQKEEQQKLKVNHLNLLTQLQHTEERIQTLQNLCRQLWFAFSANKFKTICFHSFANNCISSDKQKGYFYTQKELLAGLVVLQDVLDTYFVIDDYTQVGKIYLKPAKDARCYSPDELLTRIDRFFVGRKQASKDDRIITEAQKILSNKQFTTTEQYKENTYINFNENTDYYQSDSLSD